MLNYRKLMRWAQTRPHLKPGPRVNALFELRVLDSLVYATLEKVDDVDRATMVANVMYSYDVISTAAQTLSCAGQLGVRDSREGG